MMYGKLAAGGGWQGSSWGRGRPQHIDVLQMHSLLEFVGN